MSPTRWAFSLAAALLIAGPAGAADPTSAIYARDGSRVFWFAQITDPHINNVFTLHEEERLSWALGEGFAVVQPQFIVATGDLTDSTEGVFYGFGPVEAEWSAYREIVEASGIGLDRYFDLPGNHDAYGDGDLEAYVAWSLQGRATGMTVHSWTVEMPFGRYHFYGAATTGNDGAQWPFDHQELTEGELQHAADAFAAEDDARLRIVFGHHDYRGAERHERFEDLLRDSGVGHYMHGHEHDLVVTPDEATGVMLTRAPSLGQSGRDQFVVWAVDSDTVSHGVTDADDPWPVIVITAPANRYWDRRGDRRDFYAPPVPVTCDAAPVRALVFDAAPIERVRFRLDGGPWALMEQAAEPAAQWRGVFDATALGPGRHTVEVEATGTQAHRTESHVEMVEAPCELGEPEGIVPPDAGVEPPSDAGPEPDAGVEPGSDAEPPPLDAGSEPDADVEPGADAAPPLDAGPLPPDVGAALPADAEPEGDAAGDPGAAPDAVNRVALDTGAAEAGAAGNVAGGACDCRLGGDARGAGLFLSGLLLGGLLRRRRRRSR